jgi:hypothetical protein
MVMLQEQLIINQALMSPSYNPNYSEGRDQEDGGLRPASGK